MEIKSVYQTRERKGFKCEGESMTRQEFKDDTDVNYIVEKYLKTGVSVQMSKDPIYGDFSEVIDYKDAMNLAIKAQEQFAGLPAKLRKQLDNDPEKFLEFVNDSENLDEMIKYGLIEKQLTEVEPAVKQTSSVEETGTSTGEEPGV